MAKQFDLEALQQQVKENDAEQEFAQRMGYKPGLPTKTITCSTAPN